MIYLARAFSHTPLILVRWKKPSYFSVDRGVSSEGNNVVGCAELRHVEPIDTLSDFLIWRKCNLDGPMLHLGMCQQVLDSSHDLCNACLVVGSQQSRSVCHNEVLPLVQQHVREVGGAQNHVLLRI